MFRQILLFTVVVIALSLQSCARRGSPVGGDKDSIPPVFVKSMPVNNSVNFDAKKIRIYFDEYIKLKDLNKQLVISPPQKNTPVIMPMGTASKYINIKIIDTLAENTTYSFNFGNAVIDNNEGNIYPQFKYVFSTGTYLDSLTLKGTVKDAFLEETSKSIALLLYEVNDQFTDSIIFKKKPNYVSSTLDSTVFEFTNLKKGKYLLVALKDASFNYVFNPREDKIGYVKNYIELPTTDSSFVLKIFKEVPDFRVLKPKELSLGKISIGYAGVHKDLKVKLLTPTPTDFKSKFIYQKDKDTLLYYYTPFDVDSLNFEITNTDFKQQYRVLLRKKKLDSLQIKSNINGVMQLRDTFSLISNNPIVEIDTKYMELMDKDSTVLDITTETIGTKLNIYFDRKYNNSYKFTLLPKALKDIYGVENDSLEVAFSTKHPDEYGVILLKINKIGKTPIIVELLSKTGDLIAREYARTKTNFSFINLERATYKIRVIRDLNANGIWDPGHFLNKTQPEPVLYFEKELEISANWELNEVFDLKE
ncbi:MAG: Ig-like domain-containing protein [Flavobacteriaceae bacterium]|nr:Ig-like domain-containing protein [Flavobacteriaceae bacterium]